MMNFKVIFGNPWFLLIFIPLAFFPLWFYFRSSQKYRRTRNRISSLVLHFLVLVLGIFVLSGVAFAYEKPNYENELLLLVDVSFSNSNGDKDLTSSEFKNSVEGKKNEFIKSIIEANNGVFTVGIITFAREPYYVAPLNINSAVVYDQYMNAPPPQDDSATNIAAALTFAKDVFEFPDSGKKIIIITDGLETDGSALGTIMSLVSEGIKVDVAEFSEELGNEIQIDGIELPNYNIMIEETVKIGISIQSTYAGSAFITLYDNGVPDTAIPVNLTIGVQIVMVNHTFMTSAAHQLYVEISGDDTVLQNDHYYCYLYLDIYDKILILDKYNESKELHSLINGNFNSPVETRDINEAPDTLQALSQYDQIILVNIANADMPAGFDKLLHSYVYERGGGLLTVGGNKLGLEEANAYDREDMNPQEVPSLYQEMLPVNCIDYYPPLALMLVIDRSGSMGDVDTQAGKTKMEVARDAARKCVDALSDRDYIGLVSFSYGATVNLPLTPVPQRVKIDMAISGIMAGGGTEYALALDMAGEALKAIRNVEKKHVIFITDGEPTDSAGATSGGGRGYNYYIDNLKNNGITLSVISIISSDGGMGATTGPQMVERAGGLGKAYNLNGVANLTQAIRDDLGIDAIRSYEPTPFKPMIKDHTRATQGINNADIPELGGFYGVSAKNVTSENNLEIPIIGQYTPIYAQWKYGKGRVGSFMCDLKGTVSDSWAYTFMNNDTGIQIINNIIRALLPSESVRLNDIEPQFLRDNYTVQIVANTGLLSGESIDVTIWDVTQMRQSEGDLDIVDNREDVVFAETADISSGLPKAVFTFPRPGIYKVRIQKKNSGGTISEYIAHIVFSYSAEYNMFSDQEVVFSFLTDVAINGGGMLIDQPNDALRDIKWTTSHTFNPRIGFLIAIIVLFLLDIGVRKFKFKWPWEAIRDHRKKKALLKRH